MMGPYRLATALLGFVLATTSCSNQETSIPTTYQKVTNQCVRDNKVPSDLVEFMYDWDRSREEKKEARVTYQEPEFDLVEQTCIASRDGVDASYLNDMLWSGLDFTKKNEYGVQVRMPLSEVLEDITTMKRGGITKSYTQDLIRIGFTKNPKEVMQMWWIKAEIKEIEELRQEGVEREEMAHVIREKTPRERIRELSDYFSAAEIRRLDQAQVTSKDAKAIVDVLGVSKAAEWNDYPATTMPEDQRKQDRYELVEQIIRIDRSYTDQLDVLRVLVEGEDVQVPLSKQLPFLEAVANALQDGLSSDYIKKMRGVNPKLQADEILDLKNVGATADSIKWLYEAGFSDIEEMVKFLSIKEFAQGLGQ